AQEDTSALDGIVAAVALQRRRLIDALGRLRVLALRSVSLMFAVILAGKREVFGDLDEESLSASFSVQAAADPTFILNLGIAPDGAEPSMRPPDRAAALPHFQAPRPDHHMALVHVPSTPRSPHPATAPPSSAATTASRLHAHHWRLLRLLDTDALSGLAVALYAARTEIVSALSRTAATADAPGDNDSQRDDALVVALRALTAGGPAAVRALLGRSQDVDSEGAGWSMSGAVAGGPFLVNAVDGVLLERGVVGLLDF
ncbi:hypothetical protein HK405_002450, partial [Cladochytrium tenue]